jgi:4-amino-4-deoxy-L-arabinose transferase-like glycosyltransferase
VWDTTFVAFGIVLFIWAAFACTRASWKGWAAFGAGFGALLLLNPAPLALLPAALLPAWVQRESVSAFVRNVVCFAAVAFVVVVPWMLRNQRALGAFSMRTNLGVELMVGNNDDANGRFQIRHHPSNSATEFMRYREMGEVQYSAWAMNEAGTWIAEHPGKFVGLCARRFVYFWIGEDPITDPRSDERGRRAITDVATWIKFIVFALTGVLGVIGALSWGRRELGGHVLVVAFALFPLTYCVTHVLERYRFPIEPLLVLAAVWWILDLRKGSTRGSLSSRTP